MTSSSSTTTSSSTGTEASSYYPQLDALRVVAVSAVAWYHWAMGIGLPPQCFTLGLHTGRLGVTFFFVLSGFLITDILLKARDRAESSGNRGYELRHFYMRRILRIFPLYYATVFAVLFFDLGMGKGKFWWHFFYADNLLIFINQSWAGTIYHFWTLGVEQQFYLLWPLVILFVRRRWLWPVLLGTIILSPTFQTFMVYKRPDTAWVWVLPISHGDSLGLGAALAFLRRPGMAPFTPRAAYFFWAGAAGLFFFFLIHRFNESCRLFATTAPFFFSLVFASIIFKALERFRGPVGSLLESRPLRYLGKISYGLYVFHHFAPTLVTRLIPLHEWALPAPVQFLLFGLVTIAAASLSWYLLELPFLRLKKYFPY